ncbi:MAG: hypothetical protein Q9224_006571, partial [Gallowayella concinna]
AKGMKVTSEELAEAQSGLFPADDGRWGMLPLIYRVKNIEWRGIHSWEEVQEHKLPLRLAALSGTGNDKEKGVQEGWRNSSEGEDMEASFMPEMEKDSKTSVDDSMDMVVDEVRKRNQR